MKFYRNATSGVVLAILVVVSISFVTGARVLFAQADVPAPADSGFSAAPKSGIAPLIVGFKYQGAGKQPKLDFGDGGSSAMNAAPICATCVPVHFVSHSYAAAGTYTATLTANGQAAGTVTITVSK